MKVLLASVLSLALASATFPSDKPNDKPNNKKKQPEADPVTWGMLSRADGCVIFKESRKTNVKFFGVAATEKIYNVLDVIETQRYDMAQKHFTEDQDTLNQLQRLAVSDRVTFVKIQEGYSPALLDKARAICTTSLGPASSPDSGAGYSPSASN